jgi:hypothetical protein
MVSHPAKNAFLAACSRVEKRKKKLKKKKPIQLAVEIVTPGALSAQLTS